MNSLRRELHRPEHRTGNTGTRETTMNTAIRTSRTTRTELESEVRRFRISGLEVQSAEDVRQAMRELNLEALVYVARGFAIAPSPAGR